jgi:hypothetical protein
MGKGKHKDYLSVDLAQENSRTSTWKPNLSHSRKSNHWLSQTNRMRALNRIIRNYLSIAGDAKLWVYRHTSDHDRQATEDNKEGFFGIIGIIRLA